MAAITICSEFGAPKNKAVTISTVFPSIYHEVMGPLNMYKLNDTLANENSYLKIILKLKSFVLFFIDSFSQLNMHLLKRYF